MLKIYQLQSGNPLKSLNQSLKLLSNFLDNIHYYLYLHRWNGHLLSPNLELDITFLPPDLTVLSHHSSLPLLNLAGTGAEELRLLILGLLYIPAAQLGASLRFPHVLTDSPVPELAPVEVVSGLLVPEHGGSVQLVRVHLHIQIQVVLPGRLFWKVLICRLEYEVLAAGGLELVDGVVELGLHGCGPRDARRRSPM